MASPPSPPRARKNARPTSISISSEYVSHAQLIPYGVNCKVCSTPHRVTYYQDNGSSALFSLKCLRMRCRRSDCESDPRISDVGQLHSLLYGARWGKGIRLTKLPDNGIAQQQTAPLKNAPKRVMVRFRCPMCSSRVVSHIWNRDCNASYYTPEVGRWSCDCGRSVPFIWWLKWRLLRLPVGLIQNAKAATLFLSQWLPRPLDVSEILPMDLEDVSSGESASRSDSAPDDSPRSDSDEESAGAAAVGGAAGESQSRSADDGGASASAQLSNLVGGGGGQVGAGDSAGDAADPSGGVSRNESSVSVLSNPAATRSAASVVPVAQEAAILRLSLMCRRCRCEFYVDLQRAEVDGGGDESVTYNYNADRPLKDQCLACPSSRQCNKHDDLHPFPPIPAASTETKKSIRQFSRSSLLHPMFKVVDPPPVKGDQADGGPVPISRSGLRTLSHKAVAGSLLFDVTPVDAGRGCCAVVAFHTERSIHVHDVGLESSAVAVEKALVTTADRECTQRTAEVSLFASSEADGRQGGLAVLTEKLRRGGALTQQQYDGERTRVRLGLRAVVEQTAKPSRASVLREGASLARAGASLAREGAAALVARGGVESTLYGVGGSGDGDSETMPYSSRGEDWRPIQCSDGLQVFMRAPSNTEVKEWWSGEGSVGPSLVHAIFPKTKKHAEVRARSRALYVNLGGYHLGQLKNDLLPHLEECDVLCLSTDSLGSIGVDHLIETVRVFVVQGRAADEEEGAKLHRAFAKAVSEWWDAAPRRPVEEGERPLILFTHCQAKKEDVKEALGDTGICVVSGSGGDCENAGGDCGHVDVTGEGAVYCPPLWLDAKLPASKWSGWAINFRVLPPPLDRPSSLVHESFWGPPPHLDLMLRCCECECEFPMRFTLTIRSSEQYSAPGCFFRCPYLCTAPSAFKPIPRTAAKTDEELDDEDWVDLGYGFVRRLKFHETVEEFLPKDRSFAFAHAIRRVHASKIRAPCCGEECDVSFGDLGDGDGMGYLVKDWSTDGGEKNRRLPTGGYGEVPRKFLEELQRDHKCTKPSLLPFVEYINEAAFNATAPQVPETGANGDITIRPVDVSSGASVAILFDGTTEVHVVDVGFDSSYETVKGVIKDLVPANPSIRLFITHNDRDHAGGLGQFIDEWPAELKSIVRNPFSPGEQWTSGCALLDVCPPKDGLPLLRDPQPRQESGFKYHEKTPYWLRVQVFGTVEVAVLVHTERTMKNSYKNARGENSKDLKNQSSLVYGVFDVSEVPFMERTYARFLNLGDLDMAQFWNVLPDLQYCEVFCAPHHTSTDSVKTSPLPRASVYLNQGYTGGGRAAAKTSQLKYLCKVLHHYDDYMLPFRYEEVREDPAPSLRLTRPPAPQPAPQWSDGCMRSCPKPVPCPTLVYTACQFSSREAHSPFGRAGINSRYFQRDLLRVWNCKGADGVDCGRITVDADGHTTYHHRIGPGVGWVR